MWDAAKAVLGEISLKIIYTRKKTDQGLQFRHVIPAFWEAEVGGPRGQEFETNLANKVKPRLYLKK